MSERGLEVLGWCLLHLLWQGALVALALAGALRLVDRRAASARYLLACGALALILVLPGLTAWHHVRALSRTGTPAVGAGVAAVSERPSEAPATVRLAAASRSGGPGLTTRSVVEGLSLALPWLVLAWGAGVVFGSLRLLSGWLRLRRLVREAEPAPPEWQEAVTRLTRRLGMTRPVRLLRSVALDVPAAAGWLRPVVLLPVATLTGLSPRQLEMVLAHELAHIRRHDFVVNLVQTVVETLFFYHPAVWWMSRVIRVEREHCCDDIAVAAHGNAVSYARALTALEALRTQPEASPALSALGGSLTERVRRLVVTPASRCSSRWVAGASVLTLLSGMAVAAPLAALVMPARPPSPLVDSAPPVAAALSAPAFRPGSIRSTVRMAESHTTVSASETTFSETRNSVSETLAAVPGTIVSELLSTVPQTVVSEVLATVPQTVLTEVLTAVPQALGASLSSTLLAQAPAPSSPREPPEPPGPPEAQEDAEDDTRVDGRPLSVEQLVELKTAGITPERVRELEALGYEPTVGNLVQFGHARVTPEYAKEMTDVLGRKPTAHELVELRHLGVSAKKAKALSAAGLGTLSADELTQAAALGLDADFVQEMRSLGFTSLAFDDVVELRALGISGTYVKGLREAGYTLPSEKVVEFKALGISPAYLRSLREAGLGTLSADDVVELRALGVDAGFIARLREAGLETTSVQELVRLRALGVDADFIGKLRNKK